MATSQVDSTAEFMAWFKEQPDQVKEAVRASVKILQEKGPGLGRPYVDTLKGSKVKNLKELRVQAQGRKYRVLFVFTAERICLLLVAGHKGGAKDKLFYQRLIEKAEAIYGETLK